MFDGLKKLLTPRLALEKALLYLPPEKKEELAQYHTLTRSEQIEFRKNLILKYGYGPSGKELYNLLVGGTFGLVAFTYSLHRLSSPKPLSNEFKEFQKKLAGAFLGGHIGQLAVALFNHFAQEHAIRNESQESFIIGTLVFAGGEGIDLLEKTLAPEQIVVPGGKVLKTLDMAPPVYASYNAFNFAAIAFQLYWQNALSEAFDSMYPLNPEVSTPPIPIVNQVNVPIAGYRVY